MTYKQNLIFALNYDALDAERLAPRQTPIGLKHQSTEQSIKHLTIPLRATRFMAQTPQEV
jgi:hypothetical protein